MFRHLQQGAYCGSCNRGSNVKTIVRGSSKVDCESFAAVYDKELKDFQRYAELVDPKSYSASLNESVPTVSAMDQIREGVELRLVNQGDGQSIQIGTTNGPPVHVTNVSNG